jgi:pyruvate/2-oxoglutarate dehydrogenase complex dihydrolipoamide acyltransferase (E2) component
VVTDLLVPGQPWTWGRPSSRWTWRRMPVRRNTGAEDAPWLINAPSAGSQAVEDSCRRREGARGNRDRGARRRRSSGGRAGRVRGKARRPAARGGSKAGVVRGRRLPEGPAGPPVAATGGNGSAAAPERPMAKPPVRKLAKDLGVDLAALTGSGPEGTITREDVQAAASGPPAAPAGPAASAQPALAVVPGGEERIPIRGVRKHTAAAVTSSAFTAPHVTEFLQIDATETMSAVQRLRELPEFEGRRPSPLLLVAKALMVAVARHPMINSSWDERPGDRGQHYVNLGIAPPPAAACWYPTSRTPTRCPCPAWPVRCRNWRPRPGTEDAARRPDRRHIGSPTWACSGWTPARPS